jgi:hypothetical protein
MLMPSPSWYEQGMVVEFAVQALRSRNSSIRGRVPDFPYSLYGLCEVTSNYPPDSTVMRGRGHVRGGRALQRQIVEGLALFRC